MLMILFVVIQLSTILTRTKTMGYYTDYSIKTQPALPDVEIAYGDSTDRRGELQLSSVKWYEHESDMVALSKEHPDVLFIVDGSGEEHGDVWRKYFKRGLVQKWNMTPSTPDPFDESKLVPSKGY